MKIPFFVVDAFTDTPFQGNPAGVFFDDTGVLTDDEMRKLCGEVSLESAFVSPATVPDADFCLRYFTNVTEVPLCGHATVAALTVLTQVGRIEQKAAVRIQTNVGVLTAEVVPGSPVYPDSRGVVLRQNLPIFGPVCDAEQVAEVAEALGCTKNDLAPNLPIQSVSTGTPWLLVPVTDRSVVNATPANFAAIKRISELTGTYGIFIFSIDTDPDDELQTLLFDAVGVWSRCFAPLAGLNEDPVTGSASGALGGYLARHNLLEVGPSDSRRILSQQGFAGGRGGIAYVLADKGLNGTIDRISVSGQAVVTAEGTFTVRRAD